MAAKLGDILIRNGVIDAEKLNAALSDQRAFGGKLGRTLIDLGYVQDDQLVVALAEQLGLETVDLATAEVDVEALTYVPVDTCERYGVFPVKLNLEERLLWIATAEPDRKTLQEVAQLAQLTLEPMLASMSSIDRAIRQHYYGDQGRSNAKLGEPLEGIPLDPGTTTRPAVAQKQAGLGRHGEPPAAVPEPDPPEPDPPEPDPIGLAELTGEPDFGAIAPDPAASQDAVTELRVLVLRLEKTIVAQGRAFRGLIELLQDKGVVRRGELGSRTSKGK